MIKGVDQLNQLYQQSESNSKSLFAEQRSNLLLVAGSHYNNKSSRFWRKLREVENISSRQRLRLTKNHIQKITKTYRNNILAFAPGVVVGPKNKDELSDQKSAELHNSVWMDIKQRHKFKRRRREFVKDFIEIGEAICKVFFDPDAGEFLGYEEEVDEEGNILLDENGEPSYYPLFTGDLVYERILGFNLLVDSEARSWEEARWVCYRKMISKSDLTAMLDNDPEKLEKVTASLEETFQIFDNSTGGYSSTKDLLMLREYYFRPCADYPNGYYFIALKEEILFEDELPLGLFPIIYAGFDTASTSARSFSVIKQLRPYQAEVNRAASKIAEHHITLGDDKVLLMNGSNMSPGGTAHGIKAIAVTGQEPKVMPGRDGSQFAPYMASQISEMYMVSGVEEDSKENNNNSVDPYNMLFRTAAQKKKFVINTETMQEFEEDLCWISLRFAKAFYHDEMLVPVIGKKEAVNIPEFRDADDLSYQIDIEEQSEDLESRMGRQLSLNHLLQYAGSNMAPDDLGRVINSMEYINKESLFDDKMIDYDNANSDILALDRGEWVEPDSEEKHDYIIKRLTHRKKQRDFLSLDPQIQEMYNRKIDMHRQILFKQKQEAQAAQNGFIPTGGFLVSCDLRVPSAKDPSKSEPLRIPAEALVDLQEKLAKQGTTQGMLEEMDLRTQARIGQMGMQQQQLSPGSGQGMVG